MGYQLLEKKIRTGDHLCSFYENRVEQYQVALPFIIEGLNRNESCLYVADENTIEDIKAGLLMHGIEVEVYLQSGQLTLLTPEGSYLLGGEFDPSRVISFLKSYAKDALSRGFSAIRASGEVTWLLRELQSLEDFLRYENMLNDAIRGLPIKILCQYNTKKFFGDVIVQVLKTHPRVLLGLDLYENPFYKRPPKDFGRRQYKADQTLGNPKT